MTAVESPPSTVPPVGTTVRTDIQGLRAVAVLAVVVYHLWPHRLSGGFVGVDVFFVISGFLITSHLIASPPRVPRDLLTFWSRRIRRLLPASLLVLSSALIASRLVAPETQWGNTAEQVRAAALYVVNWRLASDSVDYLAAENAPSPVQHFWSLSVEEQFYLVWPVLILVLVGLATLLRLRSALVVTVGLGIVVVASFAYSVHLTAADPSRAYFVTPTRVWELGCGALLAALVSRRAFGRRRETEAVPLTPSMRIVLAWSGLALVAFAVVRYDGATPFPGWQAAVPVLGTVAVIAACPPVHRGSPAGLLALRPVQWVGDLSYSIYLWHWPLIVLVPFVSGGRLGLLDKVAVLLATVVLAALTKRFVEDRFRTPSWGRPLIKPYALAALGMAIVVGGALAQNGEIGRRQADADRALSSALASNDSCFGAPALGRAGCARVTSGTLTPSPLAAAEDKSHAYSSVSGKKDCFAYVPAFADVRCSFGRPDAAIKVALVGNSHAGQWVDVVDHIARARGWQVTTYLASQCALSDVPQAFSTAAQSSACSRWVQRTTGEIATAGYNLVILTNRISVRVVGESLESSQARYLEGYREVLGTMVASGAGVVAIRDTPAPGTSVPDCLAAHPEDYTRCDGTRRRWLPADPVVAAVNESARPERVRLADLTDRLCLSESCPAVIGGVPVYFDGSHMTTTFARTLTPYLAPVLERAVRK